MRKDIMLIANYWHFEFEKQSSRYRTMADVLSSQSAFDVEIVSSSFRHQTKQQRDLEYIKSIPSDYKVTLLHEPGYKKNISLKRIYSHHCFAKEVVKYLKTRKKPDIIICSVPSLSVGSAVTKYANSHGVKVMVDIQDLWPEAFKMAINIPVVSDILFAPMMHQANRIYSSADVIMAVSNTYVARGKRVNPTADTLSIYIGTDSELVKEKTKGVEICAEEDKFVIGYVGALGYSYDIKGVIDAIKLLKDEEHKDNIKFIVMGDGVCRTEFENYAQKNGIDCEFTGLLEYGKMMKTLMACDVAVNPIVGRSVSSIINKVSDYAAAGVPVINTQNSKEYRDLLDRYEAGINVENGNIRELAHAIRKFYCDPDYKAEVGSNEKKMFEEVFNRGKNYPRLIYKIEELLDEQKA